MNKENALAFFQACEEGKGWEACQTYCTSNATFSAQAEPLKDMKTLEEYVHFMQSMYTPLPDAGYEIQSISTNEDVSHVTYCIGEPELPRNPDKVPGGHAER